MCLLNCLFIYSYGPYTYRYKEIHCAFKLLCFSNMDHIVMEAKS